MKHANNLLRVSQMNAVYFDKELDIILKKLLRDSTKYLPQWIISMYQAEINATIRLATFYYSVSKHDCTFGQKILSIKYANLTQRKKLLYFVTQVLFLYLKERLSGSYSTYLDRLSLLIKVLKFCNVSIFLRTGEKPRVMERLLNLKQVSTETGNNRSYDKYMTRELMWNGLIEIFIYMVPLINYHKITRIFKNTFTIRKAVKTGNPAKITLDTVCAFCGDYPVSPNHMGCEHVFCYSCLKGNQRADEKYQCPKCSHTGNICEKLLVSNKL